MSDLICPFSAPLVAQDFACRYGEAVIRRGGTEIAAPFSEFATEFSGDQGMLEQLGRLEKTVAMETAAKQEMAFEKRFGFDEPVMDLGIGKHGWTILSGMS